MSESYYGQDCPSDMVQVEFVSTDGERMSDYGWKPGKSAKVELYVGGRRFIVLAGDAARMYGYHEPCVVVMSDVGLTSAKHAVNTIELRYDEIGERIWANVQAKRKASNG
jgi:hypothetical protein